MAFTIPGDTGIPYDVIFTTWKPEFIIFPRCIFDPGVGHHTTVAFTTVMRRNKKMRFHYGPSECWWRTIDVQYCFPGDEIVLELKDINNPFTQKKDAV